MNKLLLLGGVPIAIGLSLLLVFNNNAILVSFLQTDDDDNKADSKTQDASAQPESTKTAKKPFRKVLNLDPLITNDTIIPPVDYDARGHDGVGKHYPPANVANKCLFYLSAIRNSTATEYGIYVADWLAAHGDATESYIAYPYDFNWPTYNLTSGWHSALAQSTVSDCFVKAYQVTGDNNYLDLAKRSLMFISVPVGQGGVMIDEGQGKWWYEEYAGQNLNDTRSYVLNGHQFVLLSMDNYLKLDNDPTIRQMFDNGLKALEAAASGYDNGINNSWYDRTYKHVAGKYHPTHIKNFQRLYDITKDEKLLEIKKAFEE